MNNDELHDKLERLSSTPTPKVDGAFANRLEASLRSEMLDGLEPERSRGLALLFRPSVLVVGLSLLIFGFAFASRSADEPGNFAEEPGLTTSTLVDEDVPTTGVSDPLDSAVMPTVTQPPDEATVPGDAEPPTTGTIAGPVGDDETTTVPRTSVPRTTVPETTDTTTTVPSDRTTVPVTTDAPAEPTVVATVTVQDGGQALVRWRASGDLSEVAGWAVIRTLGDRRGSAGVIREPDARRLVVDIIDRDATFRVEGRTAGGEVVIASDDVPISPAG